MSDNNTNEQNQSSVTEHLLELRSRIIKSLIFFALAFIISYMNAEFRHFNPWRLVMKMDSVTTPVRMVVDPSMTRMNEIFEVEEAAQTNTKLEQLNYSFLDTI